MTIIITGAGKGIGKFLFRHFLAIGSDVYGTYNLTKPLDLPENRLFKVDISKNKDTKWFIDQLPATISNIVLINCAGTTYNAYCHKSDPDKWGSVIDVNLKGSFNIASSLLPKMREFGYGRIIFFSSVVAQIGVPGTSSYSASKSGLWGLTRALSIENVSKGITVNSINLGYFDIGMINEIPIDLQHLIKNKIPLGKFGNPEEIINVINFLIGSEYTTGSSIDINGGLI